MTISGVKIIGYESQNHIQIAGEKITSFDPGNVDKDVIHFTNAIAFPGLINSHDHIEFNLFPALKNRFYKNYGDWGVDIQEHNIAAIDKVLRVPTGIRVLWGLYKNLINGFTTVINHGERIDIPENYINVIQQYRSLHSVKFEKYWKLKLNSTDRSRCPVVMHLGEGIDESSKKEIDKVIRWNILKKKIVAVHGVAMTQKQGQHFQALVWCPASNLFLLNKTAAIDQLKKATTILFGSDSTLTAGWNIWEHIKLARSLSLCTDKELYATLTSNAATVWKLASGKLDVNIPADIVVARKKHEKALISFFEIEPEDILLVMQNGNIRLFDEDYLSQLKKFTLAIDSFSRIVINGKIKYIDGDLKALIKEIKKHYPEASLPLTLA